MQRRSFGFEKFQEALELLEHGQSLVPWNSLRSLFSDTAGYVILRMGDPKKAIERFRRRAENSRQSEA